MSSRALRKAQKEREKIELEQQQENEEDGETENDDNFTAVPSKPSAFEMLSQMQGNDFEEEDSEADGVEDKQRPEDEVRSEAKDTEDEVDRSELVGNSSVTHQAPSRKRKKKKKKTVKTQPDSQQKDNDVDDIDAALRAAALTATGKDSKSNQPDTNLISRQADDELEVCPLLSIDTHHLQVSNEMRRLFGRAAFDADVEERAQNQNNRANPLQGEGVGLADAVTGRLSSGGAGLPAMLRRRNIFVQGKEEWPRQTGNGLAMEIESKYPNGITVYRFVHTKPYTTTQSIFAQFVAMMDPTNLINLLRYNPYHVATLLQVSEIAKQERDHATSGELLERALFAFGKALHPSFASCLTQGKARLNFQRPENREFFLAAWKYIGNIGMRATWRTAYEWTRLLLSLDPSGDHYCMHLVIDKLALRAKQGRNLLDLASTKFFATKWADLPNIGYSLSLAQRMVDGNTSTPASERLLRQAAQAYPWVATRMFQELGIDKIPPAIWGSAPPTDKDKLHSELYVTLGQDIWKPEEPKSFLTKTLSTPSPKNETNQALDPRPATAEITLDEARFVILTDKPELIGLVPRDLTNRVDSMSDPLRPEDSIDSYEVATAVPQAEPQRSGGGGGGAVDPQLSLQASTARAGELLRSSPRRFIQELVGLQTFFGELSEHTETVRGEDGNVEGEGADEGTDRATLAERAATSSGLGVAEIQGRLGALVAFREVLMRQPRRTVVSDDGVEAELMEDGTVRVSGLGAEHEDMGGGEDT